MSAPTEHRTRQDANSEAEQTLRLIASLPSPQGIESRVHAALRKGAQPASVVPFPGALGRNNSWMRSGWARGAAAAAIVCVVAGGGWRIYSRVQPPQAQKVVVMPRIARPGDFSNAGAMRTPHTLVGPTIAQKQKATAAEPAARKPVHSAKTTLRAKAAHAAAK